MIYFITAREIGRVKIGFSEAPESRFSKLRTDCPVDVQIERLCEGTMADKKALHERFADDRLGGEWFNLSPSIEAHMATLPVNERTTKPLSWQRMIVRATGCSPSYAQQAVSDKYPRHRITIPVAVAVFRMFGEGIGPLVGATSDEIDTLEKFCGRASFRKAA